jgi:hypothetical protein
MGHLHYDGILIEFEDRLLAHLQIVIVKKIQRGESFLISWRDSPEVGDGHSSIWVHPAQNLYFKFTGSREPSINPEWLDRLTASANSSRGLVVMHEDTTVGQGAPVVADVNVTSRRGSAPYTKVV